MADIPSPPPQSPLFTVGEEIVRIIAPVSACMLLVVLLVSSLPPSAPLFSPILSPSSSSSSSSSFWDNLETALFTSLFFVVVVTVMTFILLLLFYLRCTPCLLSYTALSSSLVLLLLGSSLSLSLVSSLRLPLDAPTYALLLLNLAALGPAAVSARGFPIALTQSVLVLIAVLVAYCFSMLPDWTAWALLVAMAVYDLAAVLLPVGPLRLLVELAVSRDEDLPALVYEARPVDYPSNAGPRRVWRERPSQEGSDLGELLLAQAPGVSGRTHVEEDADIADGFGLGATGAIKLGLGDFIFYSVLVGRAAMYDYMTVYACYLAIIAGLGITLVLLAFYRKALPALPVSIALGLLFYLLARVLLEAFVMQCSVNLLMF